MTKRSVEAFREYLDGIQEVGNQTGASRVVGVHRMTSARWLAASREVQKMMTEGTQPASEYYFEYPEGSGNFDWLHGHEKQATKGLVQDILKGVLIRARDGVTMPSMFQGRRVPALDYDLIELGFSEAEAIKRDAQGNVVFEQVWTPPSNELALAALAAYNKRFAKRMSVEHQHQHSGGVQVAHSIGSIPRKQLEQRQSLPVLEVIPDQVSAEIVDASTIEEPRGYDSDPVEEQEEAAPTIAPVEPPILSQEEAAARRRASNPGAAALERLAREKGFIT